MKTEFRGQWVWNINTIACNYNNNNNRCFSILKNSESLNICVRGKSRQGKWKRNKGEGGGRKHSCRQDYWTSMNVVTGNRWERKCAESMGAGAVMEEGGFTGLEPPYDSRWGEEEEEEGWGEMGIEKLTEEERAEKKVWFQIQGERRMEKIGGGIDTGPPTEQRWSQTREENVVFASTSDASRVMIVLSCNSRYMLHTRSGNAFREQKLSIVHSFPPSIFLRPSLWALRGQ